MNATIGGRYVLAVTVVAKYVPERRLLLDQLDRHAIAQVLLRPDRPLAVALRELGWTVVSEDATALLLQRPSR